MHDGSRQVLPGYRLEKLELSNWGTFDSTKGRIHVVKPGGSTTLLIGQNGSGKSTLVDALLTLFVRPVVRNYNVAAGGHKTERDERTYIKGAYDRRSRDEDNRAEIQFLRPDGRHYSTLLATFKNDRGEAFTVAQILYLSADGSTEKVYCFSPTEKSIAVDCSALATTERVRQQLEKRGFRATEKYTEYHSWIAKLTNMRPKAMDMFNQTVAVKDIQSLNRFIREHMLEAKPWAERIDNLQAHFTQLTEAHQSLVRVRRQFELLEPIAERAEVYKGRLSALVEAEALWHAVEPYFRHATVELMDPAAAAIDQELVAVEETKRRLDADLELGRDEERRLKNEIENAGGERLRQIPLLIKRHESESEAKRERHQRFRGALESSGLEADVTGEESLRALQDTLPAHLKTLDERSQTLRKDRDDVLLDRGDAHRELAETRRELEALGNRTTKLPERHAEVRRQLCGALRLPEGDLPFAAEVIAVLPEAKEWESSIEMVLRPFALSLLVPQRHYAVVSSHIDRNKIRDGRGAGQRLIYLRVGDRQAPHRGRPVTQSHSLLRKLKLKDGHSLTPWVRGELEERFDYQCCDTIEELQAAHDLALTRERHVKSRGIRHEKDDRDRAADPREFVLGWDNREKRKHLAQQIEKLGREISEMDVYLDRLEKELSRSDTQKRAIADLAAVSNYAALNFAAEERAIKSLREEKRALEEQNDTIQLLRHTLSAVEDNQKTLQAERDGLIRTHARLERDLDFARRQVAHARQALAALERSGDLARHSAMFPKLSDRLKDEPLTSPDIVQREASFNHTLREEADRLREELEPLRNELCKHMNQYLREFTDEQADLDATVEYLGSFCEVFDQIRKDGLPRHELRFKERLNEKVIQEIGILNGAFQTERAEIEQKIELLNRSLRQLDYHAGTFMRLEPRQVRDPEVQEFQSSLRECLAGTFEGTLAADEARYLRIERLLARLRDDQRWRERVTDVRRWFDFAARELDRVSNEEKSYYEDSTGQSGGEKAKLAFTILVAAIAYQYDIDPARPSSDRLHFVVVDEMFSKVDDHYSEYALQLFQKFGLQLLIVAPLDAKARVTEPYVECYLHVVKDTRTHHAEIFSMTAREFEEAVLGRPVVVVEKTAAVV